MNSTVQTSAAVATARASAAERSARPSSPCNPCRAGSRQSPIRDRRRRRRRRWHSRDCQRTGRCKCSAPAAAAPLAASGGFRSRQAACAEAVWPVAEVVWPVAPVGAAGMKVAVSKGAVAPVGTAGQPIRHSSSPRGNCTWLHRRHLAGAAATLLTESHHRP